MKYWLLSLLALFLLVPYGSQEAHAACSDPPGPGVNYARCDLTLNGINFTNLNLSGANLSGAILDGLHLSNSKLIGADLTGASLQGTYFEKTNLTNSIARNINAGFGNFQNSILTNADFSGAILSNADFTSADITNLNLSGADLSFSDFTNAYIHGNTFNSTTIFSGATYHFTNFSNDNLSRLDLSHADFASANFTGSNLSNSNLQGSTFTNANFHLANLSGADLTGAILNGAIFTGANLSGAILACSGNPICITAADTIPPVVTPPSNQLSAATDASGAIVYYPPATATDNVGVVGSVQCIPPSGSLFPVGVTTVTCSAHDAAGNIGTATFTVTVTDTTPPTINVPSSITAEATGPTGAIVTYSVTATDNVGVTSGPTCSMPSGSTFPLGITTVTCTAHDAAGNIGTNSFTVKVQDTTPPTINVPSSITAEATGPTGAIVTYSVTATDNVGVTSGPTCSMPSGSTFPLGITTVTCTAHDAAGNIGTNSFTVKVQDTTPPTITAPPTITLPATGPLTIIASLGTPIVHDTVDQNPTVTNDVQLHFQNGFLPGTSIVTWTATDHSGNKANATQQVIITTTTDVPIIAAPATITVEATGPLTQVANLGTPTVTDLVYPNLTVTNNAQSAFPNGYAVGNNTVIWTVTNPAGHIASASQHVIVQDTTPPTINVPSSITAEATSQNGAAVTYNATATDLVSGTVTVTCTPPSGTSFPFGSTTVTCNAQDAVHNVSTKSFTVKVQDTTPPTINVPSSITAEATSQNGAAVTYNATATDLVSGTVTVTCTPPSGTSFPFGSTTVTCNAQDAVHNVSTKSFTVKVQDTTPPTITAPPSITIQSNGTLTPVSLGTPIVHDIVDPNPIVTNNATLGGFSVGTTIVTWTATDHSGNKATALQTVTILPRNTQGEMIGKGQIGKHTNFEFDVRSPNGSVFAGSLDFDDKSAKIDLDSKQITGLFVDSTGTKGTIDGTAKLDGKTGYTFHVYVEDNDKQHVTDVFTIQIFDSTGKQVYSNNGKMTSGDILIFKTVKDSDDHRKNFEHDDDKHHSSGGNDSGDKHHSSGGNDSGDKHHSSGGNDGNNHD